MLYFTKEVRKLPNANKIVNAYIRCPPGRPTLIGGGHRAFDDDGWYFIEVCQSIDDLPEPKALHFCRGKKRDDPEHGRLAPLDAIS